MRTGRIDFISKGFILPAISVLVIVSLYPAVFGVVTSLFDWHWGDQAVFVGFKNYFSLFTSKDFYTVLYNTGRFAAAAALIEISLGYYLAVQVDKLKINTGLIKGLLMMPLMISGIITALMSKVILDPYIGVIPQLFSGLGINDFPFFGSPKTAMPTIIAVDTWWQTAFIFIIILAGLQGIPISTIEASQIEGASDFQVFWRIKFPILKNLLITVIIFRLIDILKIFDLVFGTTGGGPNLSTEVFQTFAYRTAYKFRDIGMSMTIIVVFSCIMLILCILFHKLRDQDDIQ